MTESLKDEGEWKEEFKEVLDSLESGGDFCVAKSVTPPCLHPKIRLDGMAVADKDDESNEDERLAFPLTQSQAKQIKAFAEKAPFGKGMQTVVDEEVRKAWQVDSSKVIFDDQDEWNDFLESVVQDCAGCLGIKPDVRASVEANLYKLLLYEPGGHFKKHKDTEKEPGMFGTLVIQLPAKYTGGALLIEHCGDKKKIDFSSKSQDVFFVTAFFADCEHELQEVTSGWRLCLVYNLVMKSQGGQSSVALPCAEELTAHASTLRNLARQWNHEDSGISQDVLGYVLEHQYTETNLRFANLKGRDRAVVDTLRNARDSNGRPLFVVCLLLLQKWESGSAEDDGDNYYYHRRDRDNATYTMEEVHETTTSTCLWIGPNDEEMDEFNLDFDLQEALLADESLEDLFGEDPDREEAEGFTGNAGPTLEYWYYRGAVAFWPNSKNLDVSTKAGLPFLASSMSSVESSLVPAFAASVVSLLEQKKGSIDGDILTALLAAKDVNLMQRAFETIAWIKDKALATEMVEAMKTFQDSNLNSTALAVLERASSFKSSSTRAQGIDTAIVFLGLLAPNSLEPLIGEARETIIRGAMSDLQSFLTSTKQCKTLAPLAFHSPSLGTFVDAIINNANATNAAIASSVLAELMNMDDFATNAEVLRLAKHRSAQLVEATKSGMPAFTWRQPNARITGSSSSATPAVLSFLQSDAESQTFYGFDGIDHARRFSFKYFGNGRESGYSASAIPGGRGRDAYVTITKTSHMYDTITKKYKAQKMELEKILSGFGFDAPVPTGRRRSAEALAAAEAAPKKSKTSGGGGPDDPVEL
ncbi:expressed unknown protein [Seminavis robusta]|uniref:Prolyl 4-hydroxylase alpha subunit Fe(2+) 2OG dioxygenase domain-containing protein n=1 Tax=Seminavis robusta TaxID=568900 RepID=A0A9N8DFT7_9STRA|nr:expressed unknown protein [Seminavis robusta]|eukprot:Sro123_g059610.1 n/a (813) ;mRNA; f:70058-72496